MRTARSDSPYLPHTGLFLLVIPRVLTAHRNWPLSRHLLLSVRLMVLLCYSAITSDTHRCDWSPPWFLQSVFSMVLPGKRSIRQQKVCWYSIPCSSTMSFTRCYANKRESKNQAQRSVLGRICRCCWKGTHLKQEWGRTGNDSPQTRPLLHTSRGYTYLSQPTQELTLGTLWIQHRKQI